ncbi:MAG TPA: helicase-related protein [Ktedonobacterales bacterium]
MTYLPPDIIDNDGAKLAEALIRTANEMSQTRLDIATGYFTPRVWDIAGAAFSQLSAFRLLLGEEPDVDYAQVATLDLRRLMRRRVAGELAALDLDPAHARLVNSLLAFLERDTVAVRHFPGAFLHAKAYIFDRVSYVGSANFTPAGLTRNSELLLSSTSQGVADQLRTWFESKWADSPDYKPDLIAILRESKFGSKPYSPFEVFIKALYEYFKDRLSLESGPAAVIDLARFQEEGRNEAVRLLDRWGGVLIADAVGLGKTYIGLSLLEHELVHKRKRGHVPRGLIICPAQLKELVWVPRLAEIGIHAKILSQEEIGRAPFDWKRYRDMDVILVDESHNFRNPATNRYSALMKIISGGRRKRVNLMTATPVNNSLYDLYTQLSLLTRGDDRYYRAAGFSNLKGYIRAAAEGGLEIFDLLEETTIRRSRSDIRRRQQAGERIVVSGKPVRFPERQLQRVEYDLDGAYAGFYNEIVDTLERLHLVSYNLAEFARSSTDETRRAVQYNTALIALMKMLYLKRLESSAAAFEASIKRQQQFQRRFYETLRQGKLLDPARYRKLVAIEADEERPEAANDILASLPEIEPATYDMDAIATRVRDDVEALSHIAALVAQARQSSEAHDGYDKLRRLKILLAGPLKGQKALIFTSYHDTADYIRQELLTDAAWRAQAGEPEIGLITGDTKDEERARLVQRFAPVANRPPGDLFWKPEGAEIQLLISTDVLAEGQNLQDAGVIINYDLHWNPVRLIQRAGRVDRIGSDFESIALYNVFPEDELESLLGLVHRLAQRIQTIDQSVGLDASVLGEVISERSIEQLRQLHRNDRAVLSDLERQAELVSTEDMKFPLMAYIQQIGQSAVEEIPMGIHSGRRYRARDARPGWFIAFTARDRHVWRFYPDDGADPETGLRAIYPLIVCAKDDERVAPGAIPYDLIARATRDALQSLQGEQTRARAQVPLSGAAQMLYNWLNRPTLWDASASLDSEQLQRFNAVLTTVHLRPFEKDPALRRLIAEYERASDFPLLVENLDAFFTDNALYIRGDADTVTIEAIKAEDLRLVCFERLLPF